jgi:hypothetical protein
VVPEHILSGGSLDSERGYIIPVHGCATDAAA